MKKVLKNKTAGDREKSQRRTIAARVIPKSGHRGSCGQVAWDEDKLTKLNDLGKVEGNPIDWIPLRLTAGYE